MKINAWSRVESLNLLHNSVFPSSTSRDRREIQTTAGTWPQSLRRAVWKLYLFAFRPATWRLFYNSCYFCLLLFFTDFRMSQQQMIYRDRSEKKKKVCCSLKNTQTTASGGQKWCWTPSNYKAFLASGLGFWRVINHPPPAPVLIAVIMSVFLEGFFFSPGF